MKITTAIKCDYCKEIKDAEKEVFAAIEPREDIFDQTNSFKSFTNVDKSNIHFCYECYRKNVLIPASNMSDRKKDEAGYIRLLNELSAIFRKAVFTKSFSK